MKPKELDWEKEFENQFGIDNELAKEIKSFISSLLQKQREDLWKKEFETRGKLVQGIKQQILNLECLKEWEVGEKGGNRDEVGIANFVIKQINEEIKKL